MSASWQNWVDSTWCSIWALDLLRLFELFLEMSLKRSQVHICMFLACLKNFRQEKRQPEMRTVTDIVPLWRLVTEQLFECSNVSKPLNNDKIHGNIETSLNSGYYSWTWRQNLFCLQLHVHKAGESIQWGVTPSPRLRVKTANCENSYWR